MISSRISFVFLLAVLSPSADAKTGEMLNVKVYNGKFHPSAMEVQEALKEADLESHGYTKEVTNKLVKEPHSNRKEHQKSYFFYKIVNCSRIQEVEKELDTLIPGVFGHEVAMKLRKEVKTRHLENAGRCKVGMEVLFTESDSPSGIKKASPRRLMRRGWGVSVSVSVSVSIGRK